MSFDEFYRMVIKTTTDDESISSSIAYCDHVTSDHVTSDHEYNGILRDAKLGPMMEKSITLINKHFLSENCLLQRPDAIFIFGPKERFVGDKSFEEIVTPMLTKDTRVIYSD